MDWTPERISDWKSRYAAKLQDFGMDLAGAADMADAAVESELFEFGELYFDPEIAAAIDASWVEGLR